MYEFKLSGASDAFKEMAITIQKDVSRLDALFSGKYSEQNFNCKSETLEEKINTFSTYAHKELSKTFVNKLETKICMYKIVHQKMAHELQQTKSDLVTTQQKCKDYKNIVQEMSIEVKTL